MKATAPGLFMETLSRKAENAGGRVIGLNAGRYRLSQYDHSVGDFVKKPLALRYHVLRDGSGQIVQRDLYSAWLALFAQDDGLDARRATLAWPAAHPLLVRAASRSDKAAIGAAPPPLRPLEDGRAARSQKQSELRVRSAALQRPAEEPCVTL